MQTTCFGNRRSPRYHELTPAAQQTDRISVVFSAPVTSGIADDIANYTINNGVTINSATLVSANTVELVTSGFTIGNSYTLQASNPAQSVAFTFGGGTSTFADYFGSAAYN